MRVLWQREGFRGVVREKWRQVLEWRHRIRWVAAHVFGLRRVKHWVVSTLRLRLTILWARRRGSRRTLRSSLPAQQTARVRPETSLTPLLLLGCGRDGSTLLMQLLGTSPQVVFERVDEFECRYLTYLVRWSQLLDRADVPSAQWNVQALQTGPASLVGPMFWPERSLLHVPCPDSFGRRCFLAAWREFSAVAADNGRKGAAPGDPPALYYAEKVAHQLGGELSGLLPCKELYTVRDPRDVWLSVLAYDRKRGYLGFGRVEGESDASFAERFLETQRAKLLHVSELKESENVTVVCYERLVEDLVGEARRLGEWLGVRLDPDAVIRGRRRFGYHMTSPSPEASVRRWKRELPHEMNRLFVRRLEPLLGMLGYEA